MKIAYLANIRFPSERAHSVQVFQMCQAFAAHKCLVDLYVSKRMVRASIADIYGVSENFSVIRLLPSRIFPSLRFTFYLGELLFTLHFLVLSHNQYDVIYTRSEWIAWFLLWRYKSDQVVWESHEAKFNIAARRLCKRGVAIIAISVGVRDFYVDKGVPSIQITIADDGIDESFFAKQPTTTEVRHDLGLSAEIKVAMYIGGFDTWKGVDTFFMAAESLPEVSFVAIGGTLQQVKHYTEKYPAVTFLGSMPYRDLPRLQQAADVLVVPNTAANNLSSRYTSPLKLFAHMSSAKPVVITDIPSLVSITGRQLVTVAAPDQSQSLASAIDEVFENYDTKIGNAIKLCERAKSYTWFKRAEKVIVTCRLN